MKKIYLLFLLIVPLMTIAQNKEPEPIDVTQKVSVEDFLKIRTFVLDQGKTALHGSLYGYCPSFEINNDIGIFLLYLDFYPSKESVSIDSYDKIEIRHSLRDKNNNYISAIDLLYKDNKVYLTPFWDTEKTLQTKVSLLGKIFPQIMNVVDK